MVESESTVMRIPPPWEPQDILTEDALRAAQEYWFQTHATHSRLIGEGRAAVGFMKSHVRRKLEREMGEDFKMYTGSTIGTAQEPSEESAGGGRFVLPVIAPIVERQVLEQSLPRIQLVAHECLPKNGDVFIEVASSLKMERILKAIDRDIKGDLFDKRMNR